MRMGSTQMHGITCVVAWRVARRVERSVVSLQRYVVFLASVLTIVHSGTSYNRTTQSILVRKNDARRAKKKNDLLGQQESYPNTDSRTELSPNLKKLRGVTTTAKHDDDDGHKRSFIRCLRSVVDLNRGRTSTDSDTGRRWRRRARIWKGLPSPLRVFCLCSTWGVDSVLGMFNMFSFFFSPSRCFADASCAG